MANNKKENNQQKNPFEHNKNIEANFNLANDMLDDGYKNSYYVDSSSKKDQMTIVNSIEKSISVINGINDEKVGKMTTLYSRLSGGRHDGNQNVPQGLNIFEDKTTMDDILASYMDNKWIKELDNEIDLILKYMPKLREALECKKDAIISADHFAQEFASYFTDSNVNKDIFDLRLKSLDKTYKLTEEIESWVDDMQKYGESFVYIVPYNAVIQKMIDNKNANNAVNLNSFNESFVIDVEEMAHDINGSAKTNNETDTYVAESTKSEEKMPTMEFSFSAGLLESAIMPHAKLVKSMSIMEQLVSGSSVHESVLLETKGNKKETPSIENMLPDDLEFPEEKTASDGLINTNRKEKSVKVNVPGCIVKKLDRECVIPIIIDKVCLGYYYFEFQNKQLDTLKTSSMYTNMRNVSSGYRLGMNNGLNNDADTRNRLLNKLSAQISSNIDAAFVNSNQNLSKEIYMILKHNYSIGDSVVTNDEMGKINITFIPAEDIHHLYFKLDEDTNRGESDLKYSLFPAKLYTCMYITDIIGRITRGQDKRMYYIKQNVDTNIHATMLNVLNQLKRGNMGVRQMENLGNILNITGLYNDVLIPLSPSGEPPITTEVMPGQQFSDNTELTEKLERMSIDPTDVPYDLIESRQSLDYAIQATMSNSKFMRNINKRQRIVEKYGSEIITKIYNYEFNESETIKMNLPAPSFLNMTNGAQLIEGTNNYIETMINIYYSDKSDEWKAKFKTICTRHHLGTQINIAEWDRLAQKATVDLSLETNGNEEE